MRYCGEQIVMKQMLSRHPYLGSATAHPDIHRLMLDNLKSQCFTQWFSSTYSFGTTKKTINNYLVKNLNKHLAVLSPVDSALTIKDFYDQYNIYSLQCTFIITHSLEEQMKNKYNRISKNILHNHWQFLKYFTKITTLIEDNIVSMVPTYVSRKPKTRGFCHLQNLLI